MTTGKNIALMVLSMLCLTVALAQGSVSYEDLTPEEEFSARVEKLSNPGLSEVMAIAHDVGFKVCDDEPS